MSKSGGMLAKVIYEFIYGNARPQSHEDEKLPKITEWLENIDFQEVSFDRLVKDWIEKDSEDD